MNYFDSLIISFFNRFAQVSPTVDRLILLISENDLLKGGILIAALWWLWFRKDEQDQAVRERVISTIVSGFIALFVARALALTLPFRLRPLHNSDLNFLLPYGMKPTTMESWSSFPSDHGVLFFALATGIFLISRTMGALALVYVLVAIGLPRIYLGLHYPTDILAGAGIGIGIAWLLNIEKIRRLVAQPAMRWLQKAPGSFYACFFLLSYEIASMFDHVRVMGLFALGVFRGLLG